MKINRTSVLAVLFPFLLVSMTFISFSFQFPDKDETKLKLWYQTPADATELDNVNGWKDDKEWLKALPLGNGSLGAMVFGDVNKERIQLNEESMWSGSMADNDNPEAFAAVAKIRKLLFEGKYKQATKLTNKTQICKGKGSGHGKGAHVPFGSFQTLGDLWIDFDHKSDYKNYYRELDLEKAVVKVNYQQDGVNYQREIFISHPDQAMLVRLTADKPGKLSFKCTLNRPERFQTKSLKDQLLMFGSLDNGKGGDGLQYMARLSAQAVNGSVVYKDSEIIVENADEVILYLTASTDYVLDYPDYKGRDYEVITENNLKNAQKKSWNQLLGDHIDDYQKYFKRVNFNIRNGEKDRIPTDKRLKTFKKKKIDDPILTELMFQYGRYLLISSSRPGSLPANLQGLWTNKIQTPWNGDYHTDVNVQMNYWLAETTNLSEMHLPLFDLMESFIEPAEKTAQIHYHNNGWVIHPITNVWGYTSPGESANWGMHTGGSAWISTHISEHYAFTKDTVFLNRMYPVLKGATVFYMDWLVVNPKTGKLVSGPAVSPENNFKAPDGSTCQISMGPSHDQEVIWQLFTDFIDASEVLSINNEFVDEVKKAKDNLAVPQIGSDGRLMEWAEEFKELEPGHRHISHLFALHPGSQISLRETPELAQAAKKSLDYRIKNGGGHTGWSAAWLISQYARLADAEQAKNSLDVMLAKSTSPNLFGQHPPFQMDANFGTTAGIAEMLLQSHSGEIILLPALPKEWRKGSVSGLRARGGFTVDMSWDNGNLLELKITSIQGNTFKLIYKDIIVEFPTKRGEVSVFNGDLERISL